MRKLYVLSFESARIDSAKLHQAIKSSDKVLNWSHYLSDTYYLVSESSPEEISLDLEEKYGSQFRHLLYTLGKGYHGYMPEKHWQWLKRVREQE